MTHYMTQDEEHILGLNELQYKTFIINNYLATFTPHLIYV